MTTCQYVNWHIAKYKHRKIANIIKIYLFYILGEVIEISANQNGLSMFSGLISLLALGIYTIITVDAENDDDDSDSGSGGLTQPVN